MDDGVIMFRLYAAACGVAHKKRVSLCRIANCSQYNEDMLYELAVVSMSQSSKEVE